MSHSYKIDVIKSYLAKEFSKTRIQLQHQADNQACAFRVQHDSGFHLLSVLGDIIGAHNAREISDLMERYSVAQVLRSVGEFPMMLTGNGCIMADTAVAAPLDNQQLIDT